MQWLMWIMSWQSKQPALIRWLEALALFGVALAARYSLGIFYGGLPALTFYPVLLAVTAMIGWKEGLAVLVLSVMAGVCLSTGRYVATTCWVAASRRLHHCHYRWAEGTGSGAFCGQ